MDSLTKEVYSQKDFLENSTERNKTLIESRIKNAYVLNEPSCKLTASTIENTVQIIFPSNENNQSFKLIITNLNNQTANILNWVFTSEYINSTVLENNTQSNQWEFSSINELIIMVIRLFEEYFEITDKINITELKTQ